VRPAVIQISSAARSSSNAPSTTKGCACFGRGVGWGGGDGQEEDSGGEDLQTGLGQPPPGGRDGKSPFFVRSSKRPPIPPIHPANPPQPRRNPRYRRPPPRCGHGKGPPSYHSLAFLNRI
jgi:hypothetical protein